MSPDSFERFFIDEVTEMEGLITEAANRDKLHVTQDTLGIRTFCCRISQVFDLTLFEPSICWRIMDTMLNTISRHYFYKIYDLLQEKRIKGVRRLLLCSDPKGFTQLADEATDPVLLPQQTL